MLKSRDVIKVLQKAGFIEHRQSGGHKIFKKSDLRATVPMHSRNLKKGTINSIIEQSGLTVEDFLEFLR
jgi:predicted RNA binding protein YcfA (HicA-like mRNA interferase family)